MSAQEAPLSRVRVRAMASLSRVRVRAMASLSALSPSRVGGIPVRRGSGKPDAAYTVIGGTGGVTDANNGTKMITSDVTNSCNDAKVVTGGVTGVADVNNGVGIVASGTTRGALSGIPLDAGSGFAGHGSDLLTGHPASCVTVRRIQR